MSSKLDTAGANAPAAFPSAAQRYFAAGLSVIPCMGKDGKKPLVSWQKHQIIAPDERLIKAWIKRFPKANLGLITGSISNITVIDSDDPNVKLQTLFKKYGETPIAIQSPRGGYHLYYKSSGEKSGQRIDGLIDIRGEGGFIVAPPSVNPLLKSAYRFVEGDIPQFECLLPIKEGALSHLRDRCRIGVKPFEDDGKDCAPHTISKYAKNPEHEIHIICTLISGGKSATINGFAYPDGQHNGQNVDNDACVSEEAIV